MKFNEIYVEFKNSQDGTDSYVILADGLESLIDLDPVNAALYYTLHGFAHSYVQHYADQPISPDFALRGKQELQRYLDIALPVFSEDDSSPDAWDALNEIVISYHKSKKIF